jgi:hypothetical protein
VLKVAAQCLPVKVDGVGRIEVDEHLTCYKTKNVAGSPAFVRATGSAADAFGSRAVQVVKPLHLCLPSRKLKRSSRKTASAGVAARGQHVGGALERDRRRDALVERARDARAPS